MIMKTCSSKSNPLLMQVLQNPHLFSILMMPTYTAAIMLFQHMRGEQDLAQFVNNNIIITFLLTNQIRQLGSVPPTCYAHKCLTSGMCSPHGLHSAIEKSLSLTY